MEEILTGDTFESRANEIVARAREDPKWITSILIAIVDGLKKKTELPSDDPDFLKTSCFVILYRIRNYVFVLNVNEVLTQ